MLRKWLEKYRGFFVKSTASEIYQSLKNFFIIHVLYINKASLLGITSKLEKPSLNILQSQALHLLSILRTVVYIILFELHIMYWQFS